MPSASDRMPRKLSSAWRVSSLARIFVLLMPTDCKYLRTCEGCMQVRHSGKDLCVAHAHGLQVPEDMSGVKEHVKVSKVL